MTDAQDLSAEDEQARLEECSREPIQAPGAIQPHGALLVLDPVSSEVLQASATAGVVLGCPGGVLAGQRLDDLIGAGPAVTLGNVIAAGVDDALNPTVLTVGGKPFDVIVHEADGLVVVEFEPAGEETDASVVTLLHRAVDGFSAALTVDELRAAAAREVRRLTGFDHVMIYDFHPDGHGEVVAEDHAQGATPYLGLHFPASDIPVQARRLYVLKRSRMIVSSDYQPVAVVPALNPRTGEPLDLSKAELRSVSPVHLQFMRNMGQGASISLSLVREGQLIGMITCSHPKSFSLPYLRRRGCEILAERLTLQLAALSEQRRLSDQLQKQRLRNDLTRQMDAADNIAEALVAGDVTVLDFLAADGASVRVDSRHASAGATPTHEAVEAMVALWRSTTKENILTSAAFSTDRPDLAALVPGMEGIVLVDLGAEGDYLAWFRPEVLTTVNWMGDPAPTNRDTPLSPRNSFRMWSQSVAGQSVAWGPVTEAEAGELGRDIDTVLLRRVQARLAHQGLHDELTGLPNRRMLTRRLFQVLARRADGVPASLLFIDLDHFKFVNDTHGHDVGDALIVEAAGRISGSTRKTDIICRFGGDEFLVLCEDTDASTAEGVAERIVAAFREPVSVDGLELHITVSVGITTAKEHHQPADLIREADTAMYLSKNEGRNRSSWFTGDLLDQARNYLNTTSGA